MAGDWVKMRTDLYRDPRVCIMADLLLDNTGQLACFVNQNCQRDMTVTRNVMRNAVVGALVAVWGVMRLRGRHDDDENLVCDGATIAVLDDIADVPGFGEAMESVEWVEQTENCLVFPRFFDQYNSDPDATLRAGNAKRQQRHREKVRAKNSNVTVTLRNAPREEKRREEKKEKTVDADDDAFLTRFWPVVPNKVGKEAAHKAFVAAVKLLAKLGPAEDARTHIIGRMAAYAKSPKANGEFRPNPATWLNQGRYDDDPTEWQRTAKDPAIETKPDTRKLFK